MQHTENGPQEAKRGGRLAHTQKPNRNTPISRIHWVLPVLHPKILQNRSTPPQSHQEIDCVEMGPASTQGLRRTKIPNVLQPCTNATQLQQTILLAS